MYYSFDTQDRRDGAVVTFVRLDKFAKRFRKPLLPRPSSLTYRCNVRNKPGG